MTSLPSLSSLQSFFNNLPEANINLKGELAAKKYLFGDFSQYAIAPVHCRSFGDKDAEIIWFVWDADKLDELDMPSVIRQEKSLKKAIESFL